MGGTPIPEPGDEQRYTVGGRGLLVFPRARSHDSGRYLCIATNSAGSSRLEITLLVTSPLSARVSPALLTAALGQTARFSCTVAGHPVISIFWFKDGQPLSGPVVQPSGPAGEILRLSSVTRDDQGMYQCFVKNEHDSAQGTAELRLGDTPPQLVYRFIEQTIQPGPEVSLKCVATGNPTPNIKWTLDGFPLPRNERFFIGQYELMHGGDVISHVNITSVRVEDGGTYQCIASNRVGEVIHEARLNVYGSPYIRTMGEISAVAGENLKVTCPVAGFPIDNIKWYRGDRLLPINRRHLVFRNGTLVIEKVQSGVDGGSYRCEATNKQRETARGTAQINVMVPPKITPFSFRSDLHLGERVGVQCVVSKGDAPLNVHWLKDGHELTQGDGLVLRTLDEFTSVLSIGALAPEHGGNYTCVARNAAALAVYSAPLSVNVPPAITPFSFGELSAGERVRVTCSIKRGDPPLSIEWLKDARPLQNLGLHDDLDLMIQDNEEFSSVLAIRSVSSRHSGNYTCVARNPAQKVTYTAQLLVTVPPTWIVEPQNRAAKLGHQAILDCKVEGFPQPIVAWKKASGEKPGQYQEVLGHQLARLLPNGSLLIEAVSQEDEGYYMCEASNGIGVGLSAVVQLTVQAPVHFKVRSRKVLVRRGSSALLRCQALGDMPISLSWRKEGSFVELQGRIRVLERSSRRIIVTWIPPVLDGNSPIMRYVVRFSPSQDSWQGPKQEVIINGSESKVTLEDLHPATTYNIRVVAENTLGPGAASQELRVRTDEEAPSGPPRHIAVEAISSTQLSVTWEPPPEDQWNGIILGHSVGHRELGSSSVNTKLCNVNLFHPAVPEAAPRDIRCTALSSDKLQVSWQPPPESLVHGVIQGYRLLYQPVPSTLLSSNKQDLLGPQTKMTTALTNVLHDLLKFTNYSIELLAFTRVGDGVKSRRTFCRTKEDVASMCNVMLLLSQACYSYLQLCFIAWMLDAVPGAPAGVKVLLMASETALLAWQPPSNPNGVIVQYNVYVRVMENSNQLDTRSVPHYSTSQLQYQLPGLKHHHIYEFWVTASTRFITGCLKTVAAGIASFGGLRLVAWRSDVRLECRAVGVPEPQRQWLVFETPINSLNAAKQSRLAIATDGALLLTSAQRSDKGDYTCIVSNDHGRDSITHHLVVQVSPAAPLLLVTGNTQHTLQLQWMLGDDGGSPVRGFVINYKPENGEWEEVHVDGTRNTYTLSNLRCGTPYLIFLESFNDVGRGAPSPHLAVRTRGRIPTIPPPGDLLIVNSTAVSLRLDMWPDSGCPMLYYVVEYMPYKGTNSAQQDWIVVANNIPPGKVFNVVELHPGTQYNLRITAHNAAGSNVANYRFTTLTAIGGTVSPSLVMMETETEQRAPLHKDIKVVVLAVCSALALCLSLLGVCFCIKKKAESNQTSPHPSLQDVQTSATQDNKQNLARREQYYATVRKLPPSPATLECIPEYSEDIRPYATFHVPGPPSTETTKLQTFVYRDNDASPTRKSIGKSEYCRVKKTRPGEEYDSFGSESDTEPGTSSRTESSNQLDDGGNQGDLNRPYHAPIARLSKSIFDSSYPGPGPEWSPPSEAAFPRRYCQAHQLK
ncbi:Down syndrome cell adhesion molecule-like protein Dscam2 [Blattella germanica]|nr:Down syndrome cell adhesion molecule-like protein Dscam2 [Blattella germanica]